MKPYQFHFKARISETKTIEGVYTVLQDDYITAENDLRSYLRYGLGDVEMEIDLVEDSLKTILGSEAA